MVQLPAWIPGTATKLVELLFPKRPRLTLEIRQVCFDKNLASLEADFSDYKIDLYIFLHVWAVNTKEVPTTVKEWKLSVLADDGKAEGERVEDISKWQQHSKEQNVVHGFPVVRDIRQQVVPFPPDPLEHGIPFEGWVCFLIRKTKESLMNTASLTLTATDSFGRKHSLRSHAPWTCEGDIVNPEMPF